MPNIIINIPLCCGVLARNCYWEQEKMRGHLLKCFQGVLSCFPTSSMIQHHQSYNDSKEIEVFCHCRQPHAKNVFMFQCDKCLDWFHRGCERIPRVVKKNTHFICKTCK